MTSIAGTDIDANAICPIFTINGRADRLKCNVREE
jgi:hypothetical protein